MRPGKVVGPCDVQAGLTYWVRRAARGGRVALPGRPEQPVQVIDSRDLARLVVQLLVDDRPGAFHAVGPAEPTTIADLIHTCARAAGSKVDLVPVPGERVPRSLPLIRPESTWSTQRRSPARARAAGMPATPLAVTVTDVLTWDRPRGAWLVSRRGGKAALWGLIASMGKGTQLHPGLREWLASRERVSCEGGGHAATRLSDKVLQVRVRALRDALHCLSRDRRPGSGTCPCGARDALWHSSRPRDCLSASVRREEIR
ncbi:Rossmann-fold NAD(P)-binding domain-containing protein [Streptomyces antibioticus]|uniref:hypothetical protein n=1 Tax=Streptomyces antibioticus TaxID=1890 RepID=UPI0036DF0E7C